MPDDLRIAVDSSTTVAEVEHRALNGLQMVVSLLRFQIRHCDGDEARERLVKAMEAVGTIASLQRNLADVGDRGLHGHLEEAVRLWGRIGQERGIEVRCDLDRAVRVPGSSATTLALVVQELVTNCFAHAFPGDRTGSIMLTLRRDGAALAALTVEDDGAGFEPPSRDGGKVRTMRPDPALGLTLARTLVESAGADFSYHSARSEGTIARIRFGCSA